MRMAIAMLIGAVAGIAQPAAATLLVTTIATVSARPCGAPVDIGTFAASLSFDCTGPGTAPWEFNGAANINVVGGSLRGNALVSYSDVDESTDFAASATGNYQSDFVFGVPGLPSGTPGTLVIDIELNGSISASLPTGGFFSPSSGIVAASGSYQLQLVDFAKGASTGVFENKGFFNSSQDVRTGQVSIPLEDGDIVVMLQTLNLFAQAKEVLGTGVSAARFASTAGITGFTVLAPNGSPLPFTFTSDDPTFSFYDPLAAPEPHVTVLLLTALTVWIRRLR